MAGNSEPTSFVNPTNSDLYEIVSEIGSSISCSGRVYKPVLRNDNSLDKKLEVTMMVVEKYAYEDLQRKMDARASAMVGVLNVVNSFAYLEHFCMVFPRIIGSLRSLVETYFRNGFAKDLVCIALNNTLEAVVNIHDTGHVLEQLNAGLVNLVHEDNKPSIRVGFGASMIGFYGGVGSSCTTLVSSQVTAPPEVLKRKRRSKKSDIWNFAITGLELAYGGLDIRSRDEFEALTKTIAKNKKLPGSIGGKQKKQAFTEAFESMILSCVSWDGHQRLTAKELLKHSFFKKAKDVQYFQKIISNQKGQQ